MSKLNCLFCEKSVQLPIGSIDLKSCSISAQWTIIVPYLYFSISIYKPKWFLSCCNYWLNGWTMIYSSKSFAVTKIEPVYSYNRVQKQVLHFFPRSHFFSTIRRLFILQAPKFVVFIALFCCFGIQCTDSPSMGYSRLKMSSPP